MNQLILQKEHISCINYRKEKLPVVEYFFYPKGRRWESVILEKTIVFVLNGKFSISYDKFMNKYITKEKAFILSPGCKYIAYAEEDVNMIVFRIPGEIRFCERVSLKNLSRNNKIINDDLFLLDIIPQIDSFLYSMINYLSDGLHCDEFLKLKTNELLYLLRSYYQKNVLISFFHPVSSNNLSFSDFVLKNYQKVKTVQEFAALSSYSVSGFEKEFRKVFGSSVYRWMTEKKVKLLYHEINATDKPFKQISDDMGFSSLSQLNDYCKKHFGIPPGRMRTQKITTMEKYKQ